MAKTVYIAFLPLEPVKMEVLRNAADGSPLAPLAPFALTMASGRNGPYVVLAASWSPVDRPEPALTVARSLTKELLMFAPGIEMKVIVEDADVDVYINTDESGEFFDTRVRVECYLPNVPGASDFFTCESEAKAIGMVNDFLTANIKESAHTLDEAAAIAKKWGGWIHYDFYGYKI